METKENIVLRHYVKRRNSMKKIFIAGLVLLMAGTAFAQSDDAGAVPRGQPPAVAAQAPAQPPMNPIARAMMEARKRRASAKPGQETGAVPKKTEAKTVVPAEEPVRNVLVRNTPYPSMASSSQGSSATSPSSPVAPVVASSSKTVVCVVSGFERIELSPEACRATGGRMVVTAEVSRMTGKNSR